MSQCALPPSGSCVVVRLPGSLAPVVLRVVSFLGVPLQPGFRFVCRVAGPAPAVSQLGGWSGRGFVHVPLSAVLRVLPRRCFSLAVRAQGFSAFRSGTERAALAVARGFLVCAAVQFAMLFLLWR